MLKKIRHVGILVEDLDRIVKKFERFGLACSEVVEKPDEGARIAFLPIGDTLIEFLRFSGDEARDLSNKVVRSQPGAINHICFEVDDLEASIRDFEKGGAKLIEDTPRDGAHGRVAFFYPETTEGILLELCEV